MKSKRTLVSRLLGGRRLVWLLLSGAVLLNAALCFHAYRFTHFDITSDSRTHDPKQLSILDKIQIILTGVRNPRPTNDRVPQRPYSTIRFGENNELEGWLLEHPDPNGTILVFHGYAASRSSLLDKADVFLNLGYSVLLVDFMGSGGSIGNRTTLGYTEADQVKAAFDFATDHHESIWLCGTSMGAVAIMKAIKDHQLDAQGLILECPFGSMREAVSARFRNMGLPSFPASDLLTFWGGAVNGFWAHGHVPSEYAKHIKTPVLLLYGEQDDRVSRKEVEMIADDLTGPVTFRTYALSGHEEYLHKHEPEWTRDVAAFLDRDKE